MLCLIFIGFLVFLILCLILILWNYRRQIQDICCQLAFLEEKDSNMLISRQFDFGGIGMLCDRLNTLLLLRREERKKYREREALVSEIYTNLSHDIRTPLTSLDGYIQLLEMSIEKEKESQIAFLEVIQEMDIILEKVDKEHKIEDGIEKQKILEKIREYKKEQKRYTNIVKERICSLKDLLEEIFTFTKLKNDNYSLELSPCCMNRILKNVIFSYYEDWKKQGIEPKLAITEEMLFFMGNVQAMNRVLQNVIKNALDHGETFLQISLQRKEENLELIICNKTKYPEEIDITQVFERFYKADKASNKTSTGLRLAVAKELILQQQGSIEAKLKGTMFYIFIKLPLKADS